MKKVFADKRVLITGGASGLGRLMATEIAEKGGTPLLLDLNPAALKQTTTEIQAKNLPVDGFVCDVTNHEQVVNVLQDIREKHGPIDILINNAGVVTGKKILETSHDEMEKTLQVNTMAPMRLIREILPEMVERNSGHIVNIASAAGTIGVVKLADYCASKWALVGYDEALRNELRQANSKVITTIICPFFINTGMFKGVRTRIPFLLPILKEKQVAHRIVKAIAHRRRRLLMPWAVYTVPLLRLFPPAVLDGVATFLGINNTMEQFEGRQA